MVDINSFIKQSSEKYAITVNFADNLADSEIISSYTVSVVDHNGNAVTSVIDTSSNDDDSVSIIVKAGSNETIYKITIAVTTSLSYVYEDDIYMEVLDF